MHRLILDTNVFISSVLGRSYPYIVVHDLILHGKVKPYLSSEIIEEYEKVIGYGKFKTTRNFIPDANTILQGIKKQAVIAEPLIRVDLLKDKSDNKFLDLAITTSVDFLITGNHRHFPFERIENTEIISPEKYWNTYWK